MSFTKLFSFNVEYAPHCTISKFISSKSKMQLVHINSTASPIVEGYFAVPTEIKNDSGCPHTLEHLVFMGSKKYPFKSTLDIAGNICMSNTNAWTATDQTVYTLSTAGWTGFKKLLPVYLDHLINPILSDEACTTEVHHVDPETLQDKGVVYCEMEGIESQSWFISYLETNRLLYSKESGYRSETGGLTENLRELSSDEIRQFHKDMYTPDNICLIIVGNVPEKELLEIVEEFDQTLEPAVKERVRPFVDTQSAATLIPHFDQDIVESTVLFPEMDESQGEIMFSWIASLYTEGLSDLALTCILEYLTKGPLSTLQKEMVEIDNPLANDADYDTSDYYRSILTVTLGGVPTEKLQEAKNTVLNILATHKIDLERMKQVIESYKLNYIIRCEKNAASMFADACITDFLYEKDNMGATLREGIATLDCFDKMQSYSQEEWQTIFKTWMCDNKPTIVIAQPSVELYEKLDKEKEERLTERIAHYGEEGRQKLKEILETANKKNNLPIPDEVLSGFILEDPASSVDFITTTSISSVGGHNDESNAVVQKVMASKPDELPFFIHIEHFPTQFVEINTLLNSKNIKDVDSLPYYFIFCDLFTMPMRLSDGTVIPYEKIVASLKKETLDSDVLRGFAYQFPDLVDARIRAKAEDYEHCVKWIKHILYDMVFDEKRVTVLLEVFLSGIIETKRNGDSMVESLQREHLYEKRSMLKSTDTLFVEEALTKVLDEIKAGNYESKILPVIETFRRDLVENLHSAQAVIFCDVEKIGIDKIYKPWVEQFGTNAVAGVPKIPKAYSELSALGRKMGQKKAFVITTPGSSSSYLSVNTSLDIGYEHEDFPAILLAADYLQCVEGPFWKGIRGQGLAYGASAYVNDQQKEITFEIYRGSDVIKCYEVGKQIVSDFSTGAAVIDPMMLKGALSSRINKIAQSESSFSAAATRKYAFVFGRKLPLTFTKELFQKMAQVDEAQIASTIEKYLLPLFDINSASVFIACHPSKSDEIVKFLEKTGYEVDVKELHEEEGCESDCDSGCDSCCDSDHN